jgi:hypothetical protein
MPPIRQQLRRAIGATVLALSTAGLLVCGGCQVTQKHASPDRVAQVRDKLQKDNPGAAIGRVIYTLTEDGKPKPDKHRPYTAVGDVPVQEIKRGGLVTFVDIASGKSINSGVVADIYVDSIGVRYDPSGKRPPMSGDLAVVFKGQ